jgi:tetratricopeptide (TPR) repeat protein
MRLYLFRHLIIGTTLMLSVSFTAFAENDRQHVVRDLSYGVALYNFFQDKYFSSITDLMVAQARHTNENQQFDSDLLLGGLYLSYDLHEQAGKVLEQLLQAEIPAETRDSAWFNLAKLRYRRGFYPEAEQALTQGHDSLPDYRQAERLNLLANIYMNQQQYDKAVATLKEFTGDSSWQAYAQFNLGVALVKLGKLEEGIEQLTLVGKMKPDSSELIALRDKANLALGYAHLKHNQPDTASEAFNRVRLNGPLSNQALLGVGWAWNMQAQYNMALLPWIELKSRSGFDPAVQESYLAIPYNFERIAKPKLALIYYTGATKSYEAQLRKLDNISKAVNGGELLQALRPVNLGDETALSVFRSKLPASITAPYLYSLMATHEFQNVLKNYQDLLYLEYVLNRWQRNLPAYSLMLQERRRAYQQKLREVARDTRLKKLQQLQAQRNKLANEVIRIEKHEDVFALASEDELEQISQLEAVKSHLQRIGKKQDVAELRERYKVLLGLLYWQIADDYVPREWQLKKGLKELDAALAEAQAANASLKNAWNQAPAGFEGYAGRINKQNSRIKTLQVKVETALRKQEQQIQAIARQALNQQRRRIESYLVRARFAQARLYDSMAKAGEQ